MLFALAQIPFPHINPTVVQFGPIAIRWYGIAYLTGFLLGYVLLKRMVASGRLRLTLDQLSDLLGWLVAAVVIGGRLGWWLIYHRTAGPADPWYTPLAIWQGGMSFHGGLVGIVAVLTAWCWWNKYSFWHVADSMALVAPVGLFFGRIANFINAELVGRATNVPWAVVFPGDNFGRHPSQIYEALLEGVVIFLLLWKLARKGRQSDGTIAGTFVTLYAISRFTLEFTRQPDDQIGFIAFGWLTMGQLLSLLMLLAGILIIWTRHNAKRHASPPKHSPFARPNEIH